MHDLVNQGARETLEMQLAHRDYEHMSDEDMRSALEDVESLIERGE